METQTIEETLTKAQRIQIFDCIKKIAEAAKSLLEISGESQNERLYNVTKLIIQNNQMLLNIAK